MDRGFRPLKLVWIQMEGIPSKWCDCKVFAQMTSSFVLMIKVDWSSLFKSFYDKLRDKLACRNPEKIPLERLFELDKKLYMVNILVEGLEHKEDGNSDKNDDDQGMMVIMELMKISMMTTLMTWMISRTLWKLTKAIALLGLPLLQRSIRGKGELEQLVWTS
jgi:hypothetical protein